jgi:DNA-binding HxlR family transcriptional regulator
MFFVAMQRPGYRYENRSQQAERRRRMAALRRSSKASGRPIMALLDVLGRRWALRVLWELHEAGALGFAELQARSAGISPSVLSQRLKDLTEAELVIAGEDGRYTPGRDAEQLARILLDLDAWAKRWSRRVS